MRVATGSADALIYECSRLHAKYDIVGIPCAKEWVCATVAKLCQHFGFPGPNPASIEQCCDKFAQRQLLAEAGVPIPAYRVAANAAEVESAAAEIGHPVILKPAVGNGSMGVRLCHNPDEVAEHAAFLLSGKYTWRSSPRILIEKFAQGSLYWADILGDEVIGIGSLGFGPLPHFVYRESTYPAVLTGGKSGRIADVSLSCSQALSLGPQTLSSSGRNVDRSSLKSALALRVHQVLNWFIWLTGSIS